MILLSVKLRSDAVPHSGISVVRRIETESVHKMSEARMDRGSDIVRVRDDCELLEHLVGDDITES